MIQRLRKLHAIVERAGRSVGKEAQTPRGLQSVMLQRRVLLKRRNAGVTDQRHSETVAKGSDGWAVETLISHTDSERPSGPLRGVGRVVAITVDSATAVVSV